MKIIDTHCHIFPEKVAEKAAAAIGSFYKLPHSQSGTVSALIERGSAAGIEKYVINSVATTPSQVHAINNFIADTVKSDRARFIGLGAFHPESDDPERDIEEAISLGLKGIKIHPDIQGFRLDDPRMMRLFEIAQGRLPVLIHTGDKRYDNSNPDRFIKIIESFPKLRVIGAHLGGWSIWKEASETLHRYENLFVDCSSSLYAIDPEEGVRLIRLYGASRVMFGTDYPLWDPVTEVERFMSLPLTDGEKEQILYKTASDFYQIN